VLYGDPLPDVFEKSLDEDFCGSHQVDLVVVFGTSLRVAPFCAVPNLAPSGATRILCLRQLEDAFHNDFSKRKRFFPEDCYSAASRSSVCLAGREVTLRQQRRRGDSKANRRWRQMLVEDDCDLFVKRFFASDAALELGFSLNS